MKLLLIIFGLTASVAMAAAQDVTLAWDPHPNPDLNHFTLYQAECFADTTGPWQKTKEIPAELTTVTVTVDDTADFAWFVTASDNAGNESGPSNTVRLTRKVEVKSPTCLGFP